MCNRYRNIYNYLLQTKNYKKYALKKLIIKKLLKSSKVDNNLKFILNMHRWNLNKRYYIGNYTNVCKKSGYYKRTLDIIGSNRHMIRKHLALSDIPHIKKLSW